MSESKGKQQGAVQTTGHAWDGDLQEFNNPLPRWWLWGFYATVLFAVIYWIFYPAWPVGKIYTTGIFNDITYSVNGEQRTTHWNTRALLIKNMQEGEEAKKTRGYMQRISAASYDEILTDPDMMAFTRSFAKVLFSDNCAPCHGGGGEGVIGLFPNLADDDWLWGGKVEEIGQSIAGGRQGFMPAFKERLDEAQLEVLSEFVLSLSGHEVDDDKAARGKQIFTGSEGGCYACHTPEGTGMTALGSANLTDDIWAIVDIQGAADLAAEKALIKQVVRNGVQHKMPAWKTRLDETQVKLLTIYVHELGGGL